MTCKDCIYRAMCYKHEHYGYGFEYNEKPCEMFKNKADFVEVVRMDEEEIAKIKKAIDMIDDYLQEPNSIAEDWYKVLKLCRSALKEMVKK